MAGNKTPPAWPGIDSEAPPESEFWSAVRWVLSPLASLKLSVVLFAMAIFIVFAGTLAQVEKDIWKVVRDDFRSWYTWIEFRRFFPASVFPPQSELYEWVSSWPDGFGMPFPGGWAIGAAMAINLVVSHVVRFRPQTKGTRLLAGLGLITVGVAATTMVILYGSLQDGQEFKLFAEWPSMRILFQLMLATAASLVFLAGCGVVFRRRAGIVVIHCGILLMMYSELHVGLNAIEGMISIQEGQTVNYVQDIRALELAVEDRSDPDRDSVIVIPLTEQSTPTRFLRALEKKETIKHDRLPFDVAMVGGLIENSSQLLDVMPRDKNPATAGVGRTKMVKGIRAGTGTDVGGKVDVAASYIKLTGPDGADLGTWLFSQHLRPQPVEVGDRTYHVSLRFKLTYKSYSVHLVDVRADKYIGTETPRNYSSDIRLVDPTRSVDREVHIWMNNPLRFAGETFYQSDFNVDGFGVEGTGLQVVTNTGWMIPYVACMVVAIGLLAQFVTSLIRFAKRRSRVVTKPVETEDESAGDDDQSGEAIPDPVPAVPGSTWRERAAWIVPLAIVLFSATYIVSKTREPSSADGEPDLSAFGRLPVTYQGRVKPFDTLARNCLRVLSARSDFDFSGDDLEYDTDDDRREPAIRWLLDVIAHSDDADDHRVFRVENREVLALLELEPRKRYRYAFSEFEPQMDEFRQQVDEARNADPKLLSVFQRKIRELHNKVQLYFALKIAHGRLPAGNDPSIERLVAVLRVGDLSAGQLPLAVPTPSGQWESVVVASARYWACTAAREAGVDRTAAVAADLVNRYTTSDELDLRVQEEVIRFVEDVVSQQQPSMSPAELHTEVRQRLAAMPSELRDTLVSNIREPMVRQLLQRSQQAAVSLQSAIGERVEVDQNDAYRSLEAILEAWKVGDAETFNREVAAYAGGVRDLAPQDYSEGKAGFEHFHSHFEPFYDAIVLYVLAFLLVAFSWLGWTLPLNRAASWLILLTFLLHTFGLISRIYISGRPPVTNLYSSAIFIGWGAVGVGMLLERIFRLGIGNVISTVAGISTLIIAQNLAGDGDTFAVLQAVLDTQFWLATHVVCVTLGYTATFVAGLLGILYILRGVLTPSLSPEIGRDLGRAIYGITCFALLLSFFGTVLGGLWADDSWGRFWGWDPKENGALIIVLWNILVLHARWDRMVGDRGMAVLAVMGNMCVSWSWFGVNELGIGMHSYGFTDGVLQALGLFCISQLAIICLGLLPKKLWASGPKGPSVESHG